MAVSLDGAFEHRPVAQHPRRGARLPGQRPQGGGVGGLRNDVLDLGQGRTVTDGELDHPGH
jgi:hypothetical protein